MLLQVSALYRGQGGYVKQVRKQQGFEGTPSLPSFSFPLILIPFDCR